mmetsp:Transcript_60861/g.100683  ORF Transcript_60861/g.100683 Transcript_60861/m.100683 type:complete len:310 (-) Transcript_60861:366-1295(-)
MDTWGRRRRRRRGLFAKSLRLMNARALELGLPCLFRGQHIRFERRCPRPDHNFWGIRSWGRSPGRIVFCVECRHPNLADPRRRDAVPRCDGPIPHGIPSLNLRLRANERGLVAHRALVAERAFARAGVGDYVLVLLPLPHDPGHPLDFLAHLHLCFGDLLHLIDAVTGFSNNFLHWHIDLRKSRDLSYHRLSHSALPCLGHGYSLIHSFGDHSLDPDFLHSCVWHLFIIRVGLLLHHIFNIVDKRLLRHNLLTNAWHNPLLPSWHSHLAGRRYIDHFCGANQFPPRLHARRAQGGPSSRSCAELRQGDG